MSDTTSVDPSPRSVEAAPVHFLTWVDPDDLATWDPDLEPRRFSTGLGHHLLEPYARLRDLGLHVSVGVVPPATTATVVTSLNDLYTWEGRRRARASWTIDRAAWRVGRLVVVTGDHPRADLVPGFAGTVVVANPSGAVGRHTRWLPLPLQRGMVPRRADRRGRVATLALKTGTENVPDEYRASAFRDALADLGVAFRIDERSDRWPDFADIDLVLCARRHHPAWDCDHRHARKPPTKLVNAWGAGCVPLIHPEQGYLDLAEPGADALVVRSPDDVIGAVRNLQADPALLAKLEDGVGRRQAEFTQDRVMDAWVRELWSGDHTITSRAKVTVDLAGMVAVSLRQRAGAGRRWAHRVTGGRRR